MSDTLNRPTTDADRIKAAYDRMDRGNAAHLKGEETPDERRLNDAREGIGPFEEADRSAAALQAVIQSRQISDEESSEHVTVYVPMAEGRVVRTAEEAVEAWAGYRRSGADRATRILPRGYDNERGMVGNTIPMQIAGFVEETVGYPKVEATLRAANGLPWPYPYPPTGDPDGLPGFMSALAERLPYEFLPPRRELCEAEIDAILISQEAARMQAIDERYRRRYPGLIR